MSAFGPTPGAPHACTPGASLIRCHSLVVGWNGRPLLPPIDATIRHGEICALVGRNGAGKTTWFRTVLGLLAPISGRVETCVQPLPMAYIPQRLRLDPIVPLRARDVVAMGLERRRSFLRPVVGHGARRRVDRALEEMGAASLAGLSFRSLSEGQKQRVLMARLLCSEPALAVLDEPTAAMDEVAERETMSLIDQLRRNHQLTVLMVTHHLPVVSRFADNVIFLDRDSQSVVAGPPAEVFEHPAFQARYGREPLTRGSDGHAS
jgi:zinc transport system ATP-binding protein